MQAAHAGISLSEAESSVASPFTSKNATIACVPNVIREGRCALVTSVGIFKYMASYSIVQLASVLILYGIESNLTDIEYLYIDLFMISMVAFFFGKTAAYAGPLVKQTPLNSLISVTPIASLVLHLLLAIGFQIIGWLYVQYQPWFEPFQPGGEFDFRGYENYTVFVVSSFQYMILAVVFSKGSPYRKSIFSNIGFICSLVVNTATAVVLAVWPWDKFDQLFQLRYPPDFLFRISLVALGLVNFIVSMAVEYYLVDILLFRQLRYRFHNIDKSRRKFLAIENGLRQATSWPPITQYGNDVNDTPSAIATASNPTDGDHQSPKSFTEICVESDFVTPLDNCNSVLKGFFDLDSESDAERSDVDDGNDSGESDMDDAGHTNGKLVNGFDAIVMQKPPMAAIENVVIDNSDKEPSNRSPSLDASNKTNSSIESNLYLTNNNHVISSSSTTPPPSPPLSSSPAPPRLDLSNNCTVNNINEMLTASHS